MINLIDKLECVDKFYYLGEFIGADGGSEEASRARIRCAWAKFISLNFVSLLFEPVQVTGSIAKIKGSFSHSKRKSIQGLDRTERMIIYLTRLPFLTFACNLAVIFDTNLSFAQHISAFFKSCVPNIRGDVFVILLIKLLPAPLLLLSFTLKSTIVSLFYSIYLLHKRIVFYFS